MVMGSFQTMSKLKNLVNAYYIISGFPVAQMVEHGASNASIMGSIPRESKSW